MYQREDIIEKLGIETWPEDKQNEAVEVATHRIGAAVMEDISEQQFNEYEAIVNDSHDVINTWLESNVPDYKDSPVYQEFEAGYESDPEKNNPAKLFASLAWIQTNVPNINEVIDTTLAAYKQELAAS